MNDFQIGIGRLISTVRFKPNPWATRRACLTLIASLLLGSAAGTASSNSNFIRVPLGKGASIEVPRNWIVLSDNLRFSIDTFVEAKGYRMTESTLSFAANLYDDQNKTMAVVNARFYPDNPLTQADARQLTSNDLKAIDIEMQKASEAPLKGLGAKITNWYGSRIQVINGLSVLAYENQHSGIGDGGATRVRSLRVWRSPRSFTVTLSYRERDATMLRPIVDYMTNSLKQE